LSDAPAQLKLSSHHTGDAAMTLRTIVNDIRKYAAGFLKESGLEPIVKFANEDARNDIVSFRTKRGREHVVSIIVPRDAGEDAWNRAAIAPLNVLIERLPDTEWKLARADGVRFDDLRGFADLGTSEERVARLVDHIEMRHGHYTPRDDLAEQVCTDGRILRVVKILQNVAAHADGPFIIRITGDENDDETLVNTVVLEMDDGRTIDVILGGKTIQIGITGDFPDSSRDFTVTDLWVFEQAMIELGQKISAAAPRTDQFY
jgi:hypothetical protein